MAIKNNGRTKRSAWNKGSRSSLLLCVLLAVTAASTAAAQAQTFDISSGEAAEALNEFAQQAGVSVVYRADKVAGVETNAVDGSYEPREALELMLAGTGLGLTQGQSNAFAVREAADDAGGGAPLGNSLPTPSPVLMAQAQTSAAKAQQSQTTTSNSDDEKDVLPLEEIVVTGTNIRGVSPDSSPSFVFDREDIDKTGFGTTSEFIQSLPQNFSGGSSSDVLALPNDRAAGSNIAAGSGVNLRGLGSGATLVLLNGSRLAPSGRIGDFVDISMIPLSAVERVEVLTDGASAIYGADAIGGVVNFVLRDDYDGAETFFRFGTVTEGSMNEYRAGQTIGKSWDSGNLLASYEFYKRDGLGAEDKEFSSAASVPFSLLPEQKSHNVLITGSQQLGDRVTLRSHGSFSQRDAVRTNSSSSFSNFGESRSKQYGGVLGAEIALAGDWLLDVSSGYQNVNQFIDSELVRATRTTFNQGEIESELWSLDGKVDGTLFQLPGGDVKLAAGLSYREETFLNTDVDAGSISRQGGRDAISAFGEAFIPIVGANNRAPGVERLELTLAGRYEDYNDFGDTLNPKVGLLWSPVEGLNFRGTYSTSFNPPNLGDTGDTGGGAFASIRTNPASPTGSSVVIIDARPNPNLTPEESTAWTAGLDYQYGIGPGNIDLSVTWFDISYTDRIGDPGSSFAFLNDPDVFADVIIANPDPAATQTIIDTAAVFFNFAGAAWANPGDEEFILVDRLLNLATADTSGLDVNLAYSIDADDIGQLSFGLNSTYLLNQEKQLTSGSPVFDAVDTIFNPVDLRLRGNASWSRDGWAAAAFVNHVDGYVDDRNVLGLGDVSVDSWTTVDFSLSYDTGERSEIKLIDNTKFSLSVLNIFDQDPPKVEIVEGGAPTGFDPTNASPLGRFISFQITKSW